MSVTGWPEDHGLPERQGHGKKAKNKHFSPSSTIVQIKRWHYYSNKGKYKGEK